MNLWRKDSSEKLHLVYPHHFPTEELLKCSDHNRIKEVVKNSLAVKVEKEQLSSNYFSFP